MLETACLKKLIISSDCKVGPKEILQNGKGGILFKTGSYVDLYNKIISLNKNKKLNTKKIIYAYKSLKKYDYNFNLNKYLKIIQSFD